MLIACWSPKGGTGTTVVSCGLALVFARSPSPRGPSAAAADVLIADLSGDVPAVLGVPTPASPGLIDWLAAGPDVPGTALARLEVEVGPGLRLLSWGGELAGAAATAAVNGERGEVLAATLASGGRVVVADCGSAASGAALAVAAAADLSLLVLRPCYLALRRALAAPIRPSAVILVNEPGRSLTRRDIEEVLGVPVRAEVDYDPAVARAVDAGLLAGRVPRSLEKALRGGGMTGALKARVHARLVADGPGGRLADRVSELVAREGPLLSPGEQAVAVREVLAEVSGLGPLEPILADPEVTEVMVNGPGRVWVERRGRLERVDVHLDTPAIEHLIEKVVAPLGLRVDRSSPLVDARLADGSRVNAVVPPLAVDGPCLTVRRFGARAVPLEAFASPPVVSLLAWAVAARLNILVSGGTGAGKTTLLNALAGCIPGGERVVTVEDAAELRLPGEHVVRLEARPANAEGAGEVRIRDLVRNALRMRPDRIVVGEVRGPEALDMLQAMNTGHEGSLSTCHANSPDDALRRLETMVLMGDVGLPLAAVRTQMEAALDLVVQVARRPDGSRRIVAVAEVVERAGWRPADPTGGSDFADFAGGEPPRTRPVAGPEGVVALPSRAPRSPGCPPPDQAWLRP